jgi:integrase
VTKLTKTTNLLALFDNFYQPLMLRNGSDGTLGLYRTCIGHLGEFLGRRPQVRDLNDNTLGRYAAYRRALPRAATTVNGELAKLRALWNFACKRGVLQLWPTIEDEPEPVRVPLAWTQEELERLWQSCRSVGGVVGSIPASDFWYALALVLWDTGERIGAVMKVGWSNLDTHGGWLAVPAELRKGGVKERVYRIHGDTMMALLRLRRPRQKHIFVWPLAPTYLWQKWSDILSSAGLPNDRRSKFHRIRRSHASHAESLGLNATELLGHESRRTTMLYLDPRIVTRKHATDVLFRPGANGGPQGI